MQWQNEGPNSGRLDSRACIHSQCVGRTPALPHRLSQSSTTARKRGPPAPPPPQEEALRILNTQTVYGMSTAPFCF